MLNQIIFAGLLMLTSGLANAEENPNMQWVIDKSKVPVPANNPMTPEKIELGKSLFFDPRLSATGTISCNSCHNVMAGGSDNVRTSFGVEGKRGERNSPTVWNSAFLSVQFWDGRAPSLEEQAKGPITNPVEMGLKDHDIGIKRIQKLPAYKDAFEKVFGKKNSLTIDNVVKAIAAYERTLITENSPFDRYMKGDKKAISADALKGWETFQSTGCIACHSGPLFAGPALPEGTGFYQKFPTFPNAEIEKKYVLTKDLGRYAATKVESDKHMWRVPTLRNIALTAPYFHTGSVGTLQETVRIMAKLQLNRDLPKKDVEQIVAFLNSLTGEFPEQTMPRLPVYTNESFFN